MRKFLVKITIFSILVFLLFATIEVTLLFIPNTYSYKRDYLEKHINDIRILLMGSSYIEEGVNPVYVGENCFNIAIAGRNIVFDADLQKLTCGSCGTVLDVKDIDTVLEGLQSSSVNDENVVEYLCSIQNQVCYISTPVYKYVKSPVGAMGGLSQSYNRNYLTSFDAVVKMNRLVQGLPEIKRVLSMAAKYEVVNRIYLVLSHMIQHNAVDEKVMDDLKKRAIEEVGVGYYLVYQYERNKRRIRNYLKKKLNIKKNVQ